MLQENVLKWVKKPKIDNEHGHNTWLISNSTFYFVDRLLMNPDHPIHADDIFNLTKLSESILLAEKITTLPIHGEARKAFIDNEIFRRLKNDIVELKISRAQINK